jgi:tetratricopeptide (TPR) repeat protein
MKTASERWSFWSDTFVLWIGILLSAAVGLPAQGKVTARQGQLTLPTYPWGAVRHPYFRGTDKLNIYPYPMLDLLSREKTNRTYQTVVLENEYLRITFLPELGGKIYEVLDKTTGQPIFYVNHVVKPGLIGQCGAWTSGGVEWNTGPQGHTVSCMQPVAVEVLPAQKDGSRSVAIGETERIYGTKWTVVVTLRPGRAFIEERIRIYNPTEQVRPYYFWNCTAVPNTPGFRFIYPMTLGTDHAVEKFFQWPIHEGKDLSRATNYHDAASIFAWHCDQDFFGAYLDDLDRGVVAYANHWQLPGKKAWTWGQGSFGRMHQMDLTDEDGPYNEVQTGPLLSQSEVGRLDPCEAIEWQEWWYPVHGLGGFTFANRDVAVNATVQAGTLRLAMLGTGTWAPVEVRVAKDTTTVSRAHCKLNPRNPVRLELELAGAVEPLQVELTAQNQLLARFNVPLDLPKRQAPEPRPKPKTATELAQLGWQEYLFARFSDAQRQFQRALEQDVHCLAARIGLACLKLDSDPAAAAEAARAAVAVASDSGPAWFALAVATSRLGDESRALDYAWKAALDPSTVVAARALVAKLLLRRGDWAGAADALALTGPWHADPVCRNRLALALLHLGRRTAAAQWAALNLQTDPLDALAKDILAWAGSSSRQGRSAASPVPTPAVALELVQDYFDLGQLDRALAIAQRGLQLQDDLVNPGALRVRPLLGVWRAYLDWLAAGAPQASMPVRTRTPGGHDQAGPFVWPYRIEDMAPLRWATQQTGGAPVLWLGHLLFHLGRHAEGRALWQQAAESGLEPVLAWRALGMAAKTLEADLNTAQQWLQKANRADPTDAIVARDLARVLFDLAERRREPDEQRALWTQARDILQAAFQQGKGRSDFVALLARAHNRLGDFAQTARLLDTVRVTIWEGAREVHDLFEEAHLALGKAHLQAGQPAAALAEFERALEYPENLATGRLEDAREAHIHYLRGNALAALGRTAEAIAAWKLAANERPSSDPAKEEARRKAREALQQAGVRR